MKVWSSIKAKNYKNYIF